MMYGVGHILSSGTVGAALEAAIQGVPAFASSVWNVKHANRGVDFNGVESVRLFETAASITQAIIEKVIAKGFPKGIQVISINLPHDVRPDAKWVVTRPHSEVYGKLFLSEQGVFRNKGYHELKDSVELDSDLAALARGHVSIIPIFIEITSREKRAELARILDAELA
jgi:5'-nucleotidase